MIQKKVFYVISFICLSFIINCKNKPDENAFDFKLIKRNSYSIDSYNGINVYRDNETRKPLSGYYIVGDKFKKWEEFNIKDGVLQGASIVFHDNGQIFSQANYVNGKLHGEEKFYSTSGEIKTLKTYKNGVLYGQSVTYFDNAQVRSESKIENEEVTESTTYNLIGEIESQMFIKDGMKITQHIKAGKVFLEKLSSTYDSFEAIKHYNEDGSLNIFFKTVFDGDEGYLVELDENKNEIKRINLKTNPQEAMKYLELMKGF